MSQPSHHALRLNLEHGTRLEDDKRPRFFDENEVDDEHSATDEEQVDGLGRVRDPAR